jgi:hypothetical protein
MGKMPWGRERDAGLDADQAEHMSRGRSNFEHPNQPDANPHHPPQRQKRQNELWLSGEPRLLPVAAELKMSFNPRRPLWRWRAEIEAGREFRECSSILFCLKNHLQE